MIFKKYLSLFLSVVLSFSVLISTQTVVSAETIYSTADMYAADCITKGICNPITGEVTGGEAYAYSVILRDFTFEIIAEEVIDDGMLVFNSLYWQNLKKTIDGKFLEIANWDEAFYTVLIMDFLNYHTESEEFKSNLTKNTMKFANDLFGVILDNADESYKGDMEKYLKFWTVDDAKKFAEEHGLITNLKNYHTLVEDIGKVASNATSYYKNLSKALALQEANKGNLQFLSLLKTYASGNEPFENAVDKVINWYADSFSELAFSNAVSTMVNYSVEATADCIVKAFPSLEAAVKGLKAYTAGLNWLFNSDDLSENNLKIILLYIVNSYAISALQGARDSYKSNFNHEYASRLNGVYSAFLNFQNYASYHTKGFINSALFEGLFNKIKNLFSNENELTYQELSSRIDSDMNYTKGLNRLHINYFNTYKSVNCDYNISCFSDDYTESGEVHSIDFLDDTFSMYLNGYVELPVSVSYSGKADYVLSYSSSNTSVATVDTNGRITAVSPGTTKISVSYSNFSDYCTVTVTPFEAKYGDGGFEISRYAGSGGNIYIPKYLQGKKVVGISDSAFSWKSKITSVSIPSTVKSIGKNAFYYCSGLTSVTLPDSVTSLGESAFGGCSSITNLTLSKNLNEIKSGTFSYCSKLSSVIIPDSVTKIGSNAFSSCSSLSNLTMSNNVTELGESAFMGCSLLKSVNLPASLTSIGYRAFMDCSSLESINVNSNNQVYSSSDGILYNKNMTSILLYPSNKPATEFTVSSSVSSIAEEAFYGNKNLTSLSITSNNTNIGEGAFGGCYSLKNVYLPDNLTEISNRMFTNCISLEHINLPDGVKYIEDSAFSWCENLKSITLPEGLISIGDGVFTRCSYLTDVKIPDSVNSIGIGAFFGCSGIENLTIPDAVTVIGDETFYECSGLKHIKLSKNLKSIGYSAFSNCSSLETLEIPDSVTQVSSYSFFFCTNLKTLKIGKGLKNIDDGNFYGSYNLENVKLCGNISSFGSETFYECSSNLTFRCYSGSASINTVKNKSFNYSVIYDISGDNNVNSQDLTALRNKMLRNASVTIEADCNEDGKVNLRDLVRIKKYLAGIIKE